MATILKYQNGLLIPVQPKFTTSENEKGQSRTGNVVVKIYVPAPKKIISVLIILVAIINTIFTIAFVTK